MEANGLLILKLVLFDQSDNSGAANVNVVGSGVAGKLFYDAGIASIFKIRLEFVHNLCCSNCF